MALLTQYASFFVSPFSEKSATDELNSFLKSHRIINVEKKLLDGERGTGWAFLIEYANGDGGGSRPGQPAARVDYRETLTPVEYAVYDKLRAVRKELAEKSGVPVYAVFTNDHLAAMVKKPAATLRDLAAIPGIGESRVRQYGKAFVDALATESPALRPESAPSADGIEQTKTTGQPDETAEQSL